MSEVQRISAANAIADYGANDLEKLTRLLTIATPSQFAVIFSRREPTFATGS